MTDHSDIYITSEKYDNYKDTSIYSENNTCIVSSSDYNPRQKFEKINTSVSNIGIFNTLSTYNYNKISYKSNTPEFRLLCLLADGTNGDKLDKSMEININPGNDRNKHILCKIPVPGYQIKLQKNNTTYYLQINGNNINCSDITVITKKKTDISNFQRLLSYMKDNEHLLIKNKNNNSYFNQLLLKHNNTQIKVKNYYQIYKDIKFDNLKKLMKKIKNNNQLYKYNVSYYEYEQYFKINENIFYFEFIDEKSIKINAINFNILDDIIDKMLSDRCCQLCTLL